MIHTVIVDDEISGRENMEELLRRFCPNVKVDALAASAKEGITAINSYSPDLVFLDIEMPHKNGFDMLEMIGEIDFEVIFVTAFDKYAVRAFKYSAIDFLMKPVIEEELQKAVEKVTGKIAKGKPDPKHFETLLANIQSPNHQPVKIAIPDATGYTFLDLANVIRIEGLSNSSIVFMKESKITVMKTLKYFEDMLGEDFCRAHRSHIVNMKLVKKYIKGNGGTLVMQDGTEIEVSRIKKQEVLSKLTRF